MAVDVELNLTIILKQVQPFPFLQTLYVHFRGEIAVNFKFHCTLRGSLIFE